MVGTQYPSPNTRRLKPADGIPRVPKSACHDIRRTAIVRGRRGRRSREGEAAVKIVTGALTATDVLNTYGFTSRRRPLGNMLKPPPE